MTGLVSWTSPTSIGGGSFVDLSGARNAPQPRSDMRSKAVVEATKALIEMRDAKDEVTNVIKKHLFNAPSCDNLFVKMIEKPLGEVKIGDTIKIKMPNSYAIANKLTKKLSDFDKEYKCVFETPSFVPDTD